MPAAMDILSAHGISHILWVVYTGMTFRTN